MPWRSDWVLDDEIDRGGQGIVTKLYSKNDSKQAVLKQIVPRWRDDPQAIKRLQQEIETLTLLNNLGARVPAVYDSFLQHKNSEPFLIMEYIQGIRFDYWLKNSAPVDVSEAVDITLAIADTIRICHDHNIGHRDIKPTNIILKNRDINTPYILDFGISFDSLQTYVLTQYGEMFWNEFIILPECQDRQGGHRDLRSDLTALVGIFFSCITGKQPLVLRDAEDLPPHKRNDNDSLIPRIFENNREAISFFDKGFATRIADRFQTMDELKFKLKSFKPAKPFTEQFEESKICLECGTPMDSIYIGRSEGFNGYEDDYNYKCPKCGKER